MNLRDNYTFASEVDTHQVIQVDAEGKRCSHEFVSQAFFLECQCVAIRFLYQGTEVRIGRRHYDGWDKLWLSTKYYGGIEQLKVIPEEMMAALVVLIEAATMPVPKAAQGSGWFYAGRWVTGLHVPRSIP
jgi:hypothetical protein